ncbi:MAG TPA: MXAN_5187 family protein, partial [Kofleriaceae bacterium]|nr:MXAN_5187 family protein [Kofleriaceae bacterium]
QGDQEVPYRPDLVLALDQKGRVVARSGMDETRYGDSLAGTYLVDDALAGYLRDDLWISGGQLMLMAGSPVITSQLDWAGAVVIGEVVDKEFASELARRLDVQLTFYAGGEAVATSDPIEIHKEVLARASELAGRPRGRDCAELEPFTVTSGNASYWVQLARLPGEAGMLGSFYAVHIPQEKEIGFAGTIGAVRKNDLSFSRFPWIKVGLLFLVMVGVGIGLMIFETDRPLRGLSADAVKLAKGESERLAEERHRGKYGSIARSVNIAIDKLHREAKAAKKDLDNLLGPLPAVASGQSPLPPTGPGGDLGAFAPPPPSEFKFTGGGTPARPAAPPAPSAFDLGVPPAQATNERIPPPPVSLPPMGGGPRPATPAPRPPVPRPGAPRRATPPPMPPASIQDDILGGTPQTANRSQQIAIDDDDDEDTRVADRALDAATVVGGAAADRDDAVQYRAIFDEFLALKRRCGESVDNLTYDRFVSKLRSNRDALIAKHGCKSVRFQVYVKDGKAALKASPIR